MRTTAGLFVIAAPLCTAVAALNLGAEVRPEQAYGLAIFASAVLLWITELIPLPATALLIPVMIVAYGVQPADTAFLQFGNEILFLFLGAFLLAQAMHKHRLDKRIAYFVLRSPLGGGSPTRIAAATAATCFTLSMWVSNTATAAMMCPVVLGLAAIINERLSDQESDRLQAFLLLLTAYSSSIGGIATPVGSPPNLIAIGLLREHGLSVGFFQWMSLGLPLAVLLLASMFVLLHLVFRIGRLPAPDRGRLREQIRERSAALGKLAFAEGAVMACFFSAVALWLAPGLLKLIIPASPLGHWLAVRAPMAAVALFAGLLLFLVPAGGGRGERILVWEDAAAVDWGTIMLFGGGLSLGSMLEHTGLSQSIGSVLLGPLQDSALLLMLTAGATAILLTEVASNTASATVLVAILIGIIPDNSPISAYAPVFAATFATSCSFMLPVATPPNAIVYGTGRLKLRDMMRAGIGANIIALAGIIAVVWIALLFN